MWYSKVNSSILAFHDDTGCNHAAMVIAAYLQRGKFFRPQRFLSRDECTCRHSRRSSHSGRLRTRRASSSSHLKMTRRGRDQRSTGTGTTKPGTFRGTGSRNHNFLKSSKAGNGRVPDIGSRRSLDGTRKSKSVEPCFKIILEHPEKPEVILERINTIQPGSISQSQQKESNFK